MKVFKDKTHSVLFKTFQARGGFHMSVSVMCCFPLDEAPLLLKETDMWPCIQKALGKDALFDMAMPKPRGEILVAGSCYAPGEPASFCEIRVCVGAVDKRLHVFGDRRWSLRELVPGAVPKPAPFAEMPVTWANAFGGPDFEANPLGKGAADVTGPGGKRYRPLPNIEDPRSPVASPCDAPPPAGLGPLDMMWPQRFVKRGTYDERWRRDNWPYFPDDMDWSFFNAAPEDQQFDGWLRGDEAVRVVNMHPSRPLMDSCLPGLRARCLVGRKDAGGGYVFNEVSMHLETVWLFPGQERGVIIFRGTTPVADDEADDVDCLLVDTEPLASEPRPVEEYAARTDRKRMRERKRPPGIEAAMAAFKAGIPKPRKPNLPFQNMPKRSPCPPPDMEAVMTRLNAQEAAARQKLEGLLAQLGLTWETAGFPSVGKPVSLAQVMEAHTSSAATSEAKIGELLGQLLPGGLDAAYAEKPKPVQPRPSALRKLLQESMDRVAHGEKPLSLQEMKELFRASIPKPKAPDVSGLLAGPPGPPQPSPEMEQGLAKVLASEAAARARLQEQLGKHGLTMKDLGLPEDPFATKPTAESALKTAGQATEPKEIFSQLKAREAAAFERMNETFHKYGLPPVTRQELGVQELGEFPALTDFAAMKAETQATWAERDRKLAQMQEHLVAVLPRKVRPRRRLKPQEPLTRARVEQGYAQGESFREANFKGVDLSGLTLTGIDLALADLSGADLSGTDLTDGVLSDALMTGANLTGAKLCKARLDGADAEGAIFAAANLSGAELGEGEFAKADFTGAVLVAARLKEARFAEARLGKANLSGADLAKADFAKADLSEANLCRIKADKARFEAAVLSHADLSEADLAKVDFTSADLSGAVLRKARLEGTIFVEGSLQGADLSGAAGKWTRFVRMDLSAAVFRDCALDAPQFTDSILQSADFRAMSAQRALFRGTSGEHATFEGAKLFKCQFKAARLPRAVFRGAAADKSYFGEADLTGADFSGARLRMASFAKTILRGAVFFQADAQGAQFKKADLSGANMRRIDLLGGMLRKAVLLGTDLRGANLYGVGFFRAKVGDTDLRGANLKKSHLQHLTDVEGLRGQARDR